MRTIVIAILAVAAANAQAHHSDAGLDLSHAITIDGTVTGYHWRNPHVYFTVAATGADGNDAEWRLQMTSVAALTRMGWHAETLRPGDRVAVTAFPATNGRAYAKLESIAYADGRAVAEAPGTAIAEPARVAGTAVATSLAGRWLTDEVTALRFPSRIDGLFARNATLTAEGRVKQAGYDENSADNPQLRCLSRPPPAMILYSDLYPLEIEFDATAATVTMRSGYFDAVRTVYVDGRAHPPASERFYEGHAVGHWEGETLVVDSRNFEDYQSLQSGIPFGAQKHLVERYALTDDGRRMTVEFVLEDPEYLVEPITHRRELLYAPEAPTPAFDCDPTSTTEFMDEQMID